MTKEEQLRIAFVKLLAKMLADASNDVFADHVVLVNMCVKQLLKEVKIRTKI